MTTNHNEYRFQVHLGGMIDILSHHLYSSPRVFIRELLQNAVDAITARKELEPECQGEVLVELTQTEDQPIMLIEDNGVGLTEEEIHQFLAMIGQSSKSGAKRLMEDTSFIGRFGIGLLSCFMVCDEIVLLTHSIKGSPSLEWKGRPDGTYTIRRLDADLRFGTKLYLRCKAGCADYFQPDRVQDLLYHYGALLPFPIMLHTDESSIIANGTLPVWIEQPNLAPAHADEVLHMGRKLLGETFSNFIPLKTSSGRTGGIAYILPHAVSLNMKKTHRVYLKRMLVSDKAENILPDWAFFVKCIIWTDELQPTASREGFYENKQLEDVRTALGGAIRSELMRWSTKEPERLKQLVSVHALSLKALAVEDEEFFQLIYRWLPFESTYGYVTLGELLDRHWRLIYTETVDAYRQITHVAAAQSMLVINGGYIYDAQLLQRLPSVCPEVETERLNPAEVSVTFGDLTFEERALYQGMLQLADQALRRFRCRVELRRFQPDHLPAIYLASKEHTMLRSIEATQEESLELFASILNNVSEIYRQASYATLCLNLNNSVIQRLLEARGAELLHAGMEMLYVQALLMGHYPLKQEEQQLLNDGIIRFMDWGLRLNASDKGEKP